MGRCLCLSMACACEHIHACVVRVYIWQVCTCARVCMCMECGVRCGREMHRSRPVGTGSGRVGRAPWGTLPSPDPNRAWVLPVLISISHVRGESVGRWKILESEVRAFPGHSFLFPFLGPCNRVGVAKAWRWPGCALVAGGLGKQDPGCPWGQVRLPAWCWTAVGTHLRPCPAQLLLLLQP